VERFGGKGGVEKTEDEELRGERTGVKICTCTPAAASTPSSTRRYWCGSMLDKAVRAGAAPMASMV
jgi:hypothetical protein